MKAKKTYFFAIIVAIVVASFALSRIKSTDLIFDANIEALSRTEGSAGKCYTQSATGSQGYATFCYTGQYPYKCMGPNYGCFANHKNDCIY